MTDLKVEFIEDGHKYLINGVEARLSLTQLLRKHNLAPDYSSAKKEVLEKAAHRGTNFHKELENIITDSNYEPITEEGLNYKNWFKENVDSGVAELVLGIDYKGLLIGATADDLLILKNGEATIDDHKFNASLHKEYVRWQTNLILFFLKYNSLNGIKINGKDYSKFVAMNPKLNVDFFKTGDSTFNRIELNYIEEQEIINLLNAELEGKVYKPKQAQMDLSVEQVNDLVAQEIALAELEIKQKELKKSIEANRKLVLETLKASGVKKWATPNEIVNYTMVDESTSVSLDLAQLKIKEPLLFAKLLEKYPKTTTKSAYIKTIVDIDKYNEVKALSIESKELLGGGDNDNNS